MSDKCWICNRTLDDLTNELSGKLVSEVNIENQIATARADQSNFLGSIDSIITVIPSQYSDFEYLFVMDNPQQFNQFTAQAALALETPIVESFKEVGYRASMGDPLSIRDIRVLEREVFLSNIRSFEHAENRKIIAYPSSRKETFKKLKLKEGLEFLRRMGQLYFDLQIGELQQELHKEAAKRAKWKMTTFKFNDISKEVAVCQVCDRIISKIASPDCSFSFDQDWRH